MKLIRRGECTRCGKCCQFEQLIKMISRIEESARQRNIVFPLSLQRTFKELHEDYELYLKLPPEQRKNITLWCPFLKKEKDGKFTCIRYEDRDMICKLFPMYPEQIKDFPECGYYFVDEKGERVITGT